MTDEQRIELIEQIQYIVGDDLHELPRIQKKRLVELLTGAPVSVLATECRDPLAFALQRFAPVPETLARRAAEPDLRAEHQRGNARAARRYKRSPYRRNGRRTL